MGQFTIQGRAQNNFKGLFRPEENESQDNVISRGGTTPISYDTPMMDLYKKALEEMPDEKNYHPGKVSKILAGIAGFSTMDPTSAYKTTKGIIDEPYESDLGKWKQKIGQTGELAGLEEKTNASKSKNFYDWAKYEGDSENDKSLRDYRKIQGKNLEDQMNHRGEDTSNDTLHGTRTRRDNKGNVIWSARNSQTPGEEDTRKLSFINNELELRGPYEKMLNDYRTNSSIRANTNEHATNRAFDIANPEAKNELATDQNSGHQYIVNVNDPNATLSHDLGKTRETPEDKLTRAQSLATFKNDLTQDNIKLKEELGKMNPTQQNAAYDGAIKKVLIDNPEYTQFFDASGNIDLSIAQKFPDVYSSFKAMVSGELSKTTSKNKAIGDRPKVGNPLGARGATPKVRKPEEISDDEAKKELITRGKAITPESITMAKQLIANGTK